MMGRFKASSGLFHYLIANDDVYYTDSLIRLNLQDYLYYELKEERYEYVFGITGSNNKYSMYFFDSKSYLWAAHQMKGIWESLFGGVTEDFDGSPVDITGEKVMKLIRNARQSAFIFRLHTFCNIYDGNYYEVNRLLTEYAENGNIIILQMDSSAVHSLPYLMDEQRILRGGYSGKPLFPEIMESFTKERLKSGTAYKALAMKAGERCTFFNSFTIGAIRRVVQYVLWYKLKKELDYSTDEIEKIVRFIYAWYRSSDMQQIYKGCLSENFGYSYRILTKDIERRWSTLVGNALEWNDEYVIEDIPEEIHVTEETDILTGLKTIKFPVDQVNRIDYAGMKRELSYLYREYSKPHGEMIPDSALKTLKYSVGVMSDSVRKGDIETFNLCSSCLRYGLKTKFDDDEKALKIWKTYQNLVEIAQDHFELDEIIKSENQSIVHWNAELNQLIQKIEVMERRASTKSERAFQKNKAVNLRKKINVYQLHINNCLNKNKILGDIQNSMEFMIASEYQYNAQQFQEKIDSSSKIIEQFTKENRETQRSMESLEHSFDDLEFNSEKRDVETDYQIMLNLMKTSDTGNSSGNEPDLTDNLEDMILL